VHLTYLTGPALAGRATGQPGSDSAAEYLAKKYLEMQVGPGATVGRCTRTAVCERTYRQTFLIPPDLRSLVGLPPNTPAHNIVALISGTDPALARQWLVIGAHYDHLGTTGIGSADQYNKTDPHLGADDNASGTAAVMALARRLADAPLRRPVLLVNFGAEEIGLVGSRVFVQESPVPTDSISAMFNFDMVGRLRSGTVDVIGAGSSADWHALLTAASASTGLRYTPSALPEESSSDHAPFGEAGVPVLQFYTGTHRDYHSRRDTMNKLNIDGIVRVVEFAEAIIRAVGDRDLPLSRPLPP
jgi:Zn-dependent M28 family amino/carboxypeptidase